MLAGAIPGMVLADLGAEVIKVETRRRLDYMRQGRPIIGDKPDPEQNPMFHNVNRGKLSVTLDTSRPEAVDLALRLASRCDVVIENFSPGVMDKLGMGYEQIRSHSPDIVMVSISSTGQSGPLRDLRAYAPSVGALSGVDSTLGYEGGPPLGLKHAYADLCGALHAVFAIQASLYNRRRTGHGRYIDVSMLRATVASMGVGLMEYVMTGRVLRPRGNYDPVLAPYGNYRCRGEDQWVSIAVATEEEWRGLVKAMGEPGWTGDDRFASRYQRQRNRTQLDEHITLWTETKSPWEATEELQSHGVAAMTLMDAEERLSNPHYRERGLYEYIEHPSLGSEPIFNLMWKLSKTPPSIQRHAPLLGEHNYQVFSELMGMDPEQVSQLEEAQVIW